MFKKSEKSNYINSRIYKLIVFLNIMKEILKTVISNQMKYITETYNLFLNI